MNVTLPKISKKFSAAVIASGLTFLCIYLGFTEAQIGLVIAPLGVFIASQAVVDTQKEKAGGGKAT